MSLAELYNLDERFTNNVNVECILGKHTLVGKDTTSINNDVIKEINPCMESHRISNVSRAKLNCIAVNTEECE